MALPLLTKRSVIVYFTPNFQNIKASVKIEAFKLQFSHTLLFNNNVVYSCLSHYIKIEALSFFECFIKD